LTAEEKKIEVQNALQRLGKSVSEAMEKEGIFGGSLFLIESEFGVFSLSRDFVSVDKNSLAIYMKEILSRMYGPEFITEFLNQVALSKKQTSVQVENFGSLEVDLSDGLKVVH